MTAELTREIMGNIDAVSRAVFYLMAVASMACFTWGVWKRIQRWRLRRDRSTVRDWVRVMKRIWSHAMLQRKVRTGRPGAGLAHAVLFFGFCILFVGTCLVALEDYGHLFFGEEGQPLFHKGIYYALFELTLDMGGLLLLAGCFYFVLRRKRGNTSMEHKPSDWVVVLSLVFLGITGYLVEGARIILEDTPMPGVSPVGWATAGILHVVGLQLELVPLFHKILWWVHAFAALAFIAAIPYCRLLHVIAGFTNIALREYELGKLEPVTIEQLEEQGSVGMGRPQDLRGEHLLALDACVSCGRCQDVCPAYEAGKPLSPRDLVQDIRTYVDGFNFDVLSQTSDLESEPGLHGHVVRAETLWSCTTCGACVDICPIEVAPLEFITGMRRFLLGEGELRGAPAAALQKMQRSGNPWGLPAKERFVWAEGLEVPTVVENPDFDLLYWVGCSASYDPRARKIARAMVQLLKAAGMNFACLGSEEHCTGDSARRMGDEFLFQELAEGNIATLNAYKVRRIVTHCPHCLNSLTKDYSQFGGEYEVVHHSQLLSQLVSEGRLKVTADSTDYVTYHDPCYLARANGIIEEPREVLSAGLADRSSQLVEMPRNGCSTGCCGGGGGRMWFDDSASERIGGSRVEEVLETKAQIVAVSCPFCLTMLNDGLNARDSETEVKDIAELLAEAWDNG